MIRGKKSKFKFKRNIIATIIILSGIIIALLKKDFIIAWFGTII